MDREEKDLWNHAKGSVFFDWRAGGFNFEYCALSYCRRKARSCVDLWWGILFWALERYFQNLGRRNVLYWRDSGGCKFCWDFALGIFLGRFGNFLNQELYGIPVEDLPVWLGQIFRTFHLVHVYPKVDQILRVNTNFLSMIFEGIMIFGAQALVFVRQIKKKERKVWLLATNFLLFYSVVRFVFEYVRSDSQMEIIGGMSKSQWFFVVFIVVAIFIRWKLGKKEKL